MLRLCLQLASQAASKQASVAADMAIVDGAVDGDFDGGDDGTPAAPTTGQQMESTVTHLLEGLLTAGWKLYSNVHVVEIDGQPVQPRKGLKTEMDVLLVNEHGEGVTIGEVKLAAGNAFMCLLNDVALLLSLQALVQGQVVTLKYQDLSCSHASDDASCQPDSAGLDASNQQQVNNAVIKPTWVTANITMAEALQAVYFIGSTLDDDTVQRGLTTAVSASALSLIPWTPDSLESSMIYPDDDRPAAAATGAPKCAAGQQPAVDSSVFTPAARHEATCSKPTSAASSTDSPNGSSDGCSRVSLRLLPEHQQLIEQHILHKVDLLTQIDIYAILPA